MNNTQMSLGIDAIMPEEGKPKPKVQKIFSQNKSKKTDPPQVNSELIKRSLAHKNGVAVVKNFQSRKASFLKDKIDRKRPDFTTEYKNPRKITNTNSLYLAIFKLIRYLYTLVRNFPKEYKYTLGEDILRLAWATLDCVITANLLPNNEKSGYILKASVTFDKLKYRLRLAYEIKNISTKQEAFLIEQNTQIAKMLAGWKKWAKHTPNSLSLTGQP